MHLEFLQTIFEEKSGREAIIFQGTVYTYRWLLENLRSWQGRLSSKNIGSGTVVALQSGFSPNSVALLLALIEQGCIIIPITVTASGKAGEFLEIGQAEVLVTVDCEDQAIIVPTGRNATHPLYQDLRQAGRPGLVLFSSGSTGKSKAAVHDVSRLLQKFHTRRYDLRTLAFMLFDHIGGFDTLFYCLSNGSCVVVTGERTPDAVCAAVEKYRVEVLPVAPSFLNLLLLSKAYRRYDLSSLKFVTYGAEVMLQETLGRCAEIFPHVTLLQKYGTSEVGTLRSKSKSSDSLWVKLGGEGYRWRVVEGILQIKAESAMLGYLNAPSPFTPDGWFITGDSVEVDGEHLRILGRVSDIINVGGQKVYPCEVESVIREIPNIADVTVYGEPNPLLGNIVAARVQLCLEEDHSKIRLAVKEHARTKLEPYKVPVKIVFSADNQVNARFKKIRNRGVGDSGE